MKALRRIIGVCLILSACTSEDKPGSQSEQTPAPAITPVTQSGGSFDDITGKLSSDRKKTMSIQQAQIDTVRDATRNLENNLRETLYYPPEDRLKSWKQMDAGFENSKSSIRKDTDEMERKMKQGIKSRKIIRKK